VTTPAIDQQAHDWFVAHREGWLDPVAKTVTLFGNTATVVAMGCGLVAVLLWLFRERLGAIYVTIAIAASYIVLFSIKGLVERRRPPRAQFLVDPTAAPGYSFPSGHAMFSAALATALVVLVAARFPQVRIWALAAVIAVYPLMIGLSRLYLGVHWLTDVLAGWALGSITALGTGFALPALLSPRAASPAVPVSMKTVSMQRTPSPEEASCQR
jgi:undecaprenyl-diphosphatase